jgi:hypothetical protein
MMIALTFLTSTSRHATARAGASKVSIARVQRGMHAWPLHRSVDF